MVGSQKREALRTITSELEMPDERKNYVFLWKGCDLCDHIEQDHTRFLTELEGLRIKQQRE